MPLIRCRDRMTTGAPLNILDFGASRSDTVGDEVINDAAIVLALAKMALSVENRALYFPAGVYRVSNTIALNVSAAVWGVGRSQSILKTMHATNDVLVVSATSCSIHGIGFQTGVTRSSGAYVKMSAGDVELSDFHMTGFYTGVHIPAGGAIQTVQRGVMRDGVASTGVGILIEGGYDVSIRDILADHAANIDSNIRITSCGDVTIEDCNLIHANYNLDLLAQTGSSIITSVWANNTFFDTSGLYGVRMVAAGAGDVITRCIFDQCWMSSAGLTGTVLATGAGGVIDGIDFLGCHMLLNGVNGMDIQGTGCANISVRGGAYAGNASSGITVVGSISNISIDGAFLGAGYGVPGNAYGVFLGSGITRLSVVDNTIVGNTTAPVGLGTGYTTPKIRDNQGYPTASSGTATILSGTTTIAVNHGLPTTPLIQDVRLNPISGLGAASEFWVSAVSSSQITITVDANPGTNIAFAWSAKVLS